MDPHRRLRLYAALFVLEFVAQCYCLDRKVPWVSPDEYSDQCQDLVSTRLWQIGFWEGHHGALLMRTEPGTGGRATTIQSDLPAAMREELAGVIPKAALELALYFAVSVGLVASLPTLASGRLLMSASVLGVAALVLSGPMLLLCYGRSVYTNFVGPGAYSYSGGYLAVSGIAAETVSYRTAMEALGLPSLLLQETTGLLRVLPEMEFALHWTLSVVGFYGGVGACVGWLMNHGRGVVRRLRETRPEAAAEQ